MNQQFTDGVVVSQTNTTLLQFAKNELIISNERLGELHSLLIMYTGCKGEAYQLPKRYEAAGTCRRHGEEETDHEKKEQGRLSADDHGAVVPDYDHFHSGGAACSGGGAFHNGGSR